MGYLRPTAVIVTGLYVNPDGNEHWAVTAQRKAREIFDRPWSEELGGTMLALVSPLSGEIWNSAMSFSVYWAGSNDGWVASTSADRARAEFVQWLTEQAYEDGSSPLRWVEVAYTDDDGRTMVLATSADVANQEQARENKIVLKIEEPLKSAYQWADLDGVTIVDPRGWGALWDEVGQLPARSPLDPIGRGEFERRLAVSSVVSVRGGS